jgi:hypothetical protein
MKTKDQTQENGSVTGTPLLWLRLEGLAVLILSILFYAHIGAAWWRFGLLLLTPDLAMAAYWLGARAGAQAYNIVHSYVGPIVLLCIALVVGLHQVWLPYVLIWTAHIGMDRSLGYGMKYPDSFESTHLGSLGRQRPI